MANQKFTLDVKAVGEKLKQIRQGRAVQKEVAQAIGVTTSAYASIERGTYGTRIEILARIILFYDSMGIHLNMEDLIGLERPKKRTKLTGDIKLDTLIESNGRLSATIEEQSKQINWLNNQLGEVVKN